MNCRENELSIPEVDDARLAGKVRGQELLHQRRQRAELARLGKKRLKIALGRKNAVELGQAHGE
jgi:uncharacterized protein YjiS (DUF1127 family)